LVNQERNSTYIFFVVLTLISILGGIFVFQSTYWSPWAFSDSAAYLSAARNLNAGRGLVIINSNGTTTRMTEFAPFYSVVLGVITGQKGSFIETARWLNIFSFTLSIFLSGLFAFVISRNVIVSCVVSLFTALSPVLLDSFTGIMSEPLFILLLIIHTILFWVYLSKPNGKKFIALAVVSMFLPLTRYAGIIFPISAGILILLFGRKGIKKNLFYGVSFSALTLLPIALWFLDLYLQVNKVGGKRFTIDFSIFGSLFKSIFSEYLVLRTWYPYYGIYPSRVINGLIEIFFTVLFLIIFFLGIYRILKYWKSPEKPHLAFLICFSHTLQYLVFIAISHSITIPQIDIINRMLAPIFPLVMLILVAVFAMENQRKIKLLWILPVVVMLIIAARYNYLVTAKKVAEYHENGFGFNSREIQESGFIDALHDLDPERPMISNSAAFVLFHTNRFPLNVNHFHNRQYGSSDGYGEKTFREKHAPLIILIPDFRNSYGPDADEMLTTITTGLEQSYADPIGSIYYFPK
jgi:hypothetical protein